MFFDDWSQVGRAALLTALVYFAVLAMLRVAGSRALAKMSAHGLVVTVALGSLLATIPPQSSVSLVHGTVIIALFLALQRTLDWLNVRWPHMGEVIRGEPTLVLYEGRMIRDRMLASRREHYNLQIALGRLAMAAVVLVGVLVAATAAFPNFTPTDLIGALGIGGVAIGFAFKDIFQNFLAGILILITKPFRTGDQIVFGTYEGEVEDIQTRATYPKTYDGRRVVIPNGDLFINSVSVNTAFARRRMEYDIGIGYGDDPARARGIILEVLQATDGVAPDPKADVIVVAFAESSVGGRRDAREHRSR